MTKRWIALQRKRDELTQRAVKALAEDDRKDALALALSWVPLHTLQTAVRIWEGQDK
jgi:hypothetical protein